MEPADLARKIDHTLLKPEASAEQIDRLCEECREYNFFAACVNPIWVARCAERLAGSETAVAGVAGFPLGASLSAVKAEEARRAVGQGAREIDMVVNIAALRAGERQQVIDDIAAVVAAAKAASDTNIVKVIVEAGLLSDEQITLACRCVAEAQADFIKTSTGMHAAAGGAQTRHVELMHKHIAPLKVKASGGIRDLKTARAMLEAGADRLGMSAGVSVMQEIAGD